MESGALQPKPGLLRQFFRLLRPAKSSPADVDNASRRHERSAPRRRRYPSACSYSNSNQFLHVQGHRDFWSSQTASRPQAHTETPGPLYAQSGSVNHGGTSAGSLKVPVAVGVPLDEQPTAHLACKQPATSSVSEPSHAWQLPSVKLSTATHRPHIEDSAHMQRGPEQPSTQTPETHCLRIPDSTQHRGVKLETPVDLLPGRPNSGTCDSLGRSSSSSAFGRLDRNTCYTGPPLSFCPLTDGTLVWYTDSEIRLLPLDGKLHPSKSAHLARQAAVCTADKATLLARTKEEVGGTSPHTDEAALAHSSDTPLTVVTAGQPDRANSSFACDGTTTRPLANLANSGSADSSAEQSAPTRPCSVDHSMHTADIAEPKAASNSAAGSAASCTALQPACGVDLISGPFVLHSAPQLQAQPSAPAFSLVADSTTAPGPIAAAAIASSAKTPGSGVSEALGNNTAPTAAQGAESCAQTRQLGAGQLYTLQSPEQKQSVTTRQALGGSSFSRQLDERHRIPFDELMFTHEIGSGTFKQVFCGRWQNEHVAIVCMRGGGVVIEARLLEALAEHPNLVEFKGWSKDNKGNEYLIQELVPLGTLADLSANIHLGCRDALTACQQICAAMCAMAEKGIVHGDLSARNVLVKNLRPMHVKVTDFGLARFVDLSATEGAWNMEDGVLPLRWGAPEVITGQGCTTEKSDVWAFGVTAWEVFSRGAEPYADMADALVLRYVVSGGRLGRPASCPQPVYDLLCACWTADPNHRPSFMDLAISLQQLQDSLLAAQKAQEEWFPALSMPIPYPQSNQLPSACASPPQHQPVPLLQSHNQTLPMLLPQQQLLQQHTVPQGKLQRPIECHPWRPERPQLCQSLSPQATLHQASRASQLSAPQAVAASRQHFQFEPHSCDSPQACSVSWKQKHETASALHSKSAAHMPPSPASDELSARPCLPSVEPCLLVPDLIQKPWGFGNPDVQHHVLHPRPASTATPGNAVQLAQPWLPQDPSADAHAPQLTTDWASESFELEGSWQLPQLRHALTASNSSGEATQSSSHHPRSLSAAAVLPAATECDLLLATLSEVLPTDTSSKLPSAVSNGSFPDTAAAAAAGSIRPTADDVACTTAADVVGPTARDVACTTAGDPAYAITGDLARATAGDMACAAAVDLAPTDNTPGTSCTGAGASAHAMAGPSKCSGGIATWRAPSDTASQLQPTSPVPVTALHTSMPPARLSCGPPSPSCSPAYLAPPDSLACRNSVPAASTDAAPTAISSKSTADQVHSMAITAAQGIPLDNLRASPQHAACSAVAAAPNAVSNGLDAVAVLYITQPYHSCSHLENPSQHSRFPDSMQAYTWHPAHTDSPLPCTSPTSTRQSASGALMASPSLAYKLLSPSLDRCSQSGNVESQGSSADHSLKVAFRDGHPMSSDSLHSHLESVIHVDARPMTDREMTFADLPIAVDALFDNSKRGRAHARSPDGPTSFSAPEIAFSSWEPPTAMIPIPSYLQPGAYKRPSSMQGVSPVSSSPVSYYRLTELQQSYSNSQYELYASSVWCGNAEARSRQESYML